MASMLVNNIKSSTSASHNNFEKDLDVRIGRIKCDDVQILNLPKVSASPKDAYDTVQNLLKQYKQAYASNNYNNFAFIANLDKSSKLGPVIDALNKRLQEHVKMLKQTKTAQQPSAVLEYDMAKRRADKLVEVLTAKLVWNNTYEEIQLLNSSDIDLRYQKLVLLQQSFEILNMYSFDQNKVELFEKMKDEFLSWYSPATILAIDTNDLKQLENIKEKYVSLDRFKVFESNFGNYARNKIKCYIEDKTERHTLLPVLEELFGIWKRCYKLADMFIECDGSELISKHLYDGLISKWDCILTIISDMIASYENPFHAAKSIGNILANFLDIIEKEGDDHILKVFLQLRQAIFSILSEDYGKHATSTLLCTINKITTPEKISRHRHNWLMPYLEEIQVCMNEIVDDARVAFGPDFTSKIINSFELSIREINSLLQNQDILNIRPEGNDIRMKKSVQENAEDKISAICVTGCLINMVEDINNHMREASEGTNHEKFLISNSNLSLLETLNLKVVGRKIDSIAKTIIFTMEDEMKKMVKSHQHEESTEITDEFNLPSFSITPTQIVTGIGHGLLSQMNTIAAYGSDRNFVKAIASAATDTKSSFNEEEADLWLLTEVAKLVQNAFCSSIGNVSLLHTKLKRQFYTDIVFLMDALSDLRLQPTSQLSKLAEKLKEC